jgi:diguanylate cyclase (GGDEF)-like protein/PAS domain S-box-containing protein
MGPRINTSVWGLATVALAVLCLFEGGGRPVRKPVQRIYRVGVDHSPPFYLIGSDGSVTGLAVDVLNEAARRREIRLEWVPIRDMPLDDALGKRAVDMWPLVGPSKLRLSKFFLSQPWLESSYVLVSLGTNPIRNAADAAGKVVVHARLRTTTAIAKQYLPRSTLLVRHFREEAVEAMCAGDAVAAVIESQVLDAILLKRPESCRGEALKISSLAGAKADLSIITVPEARQAGEALREEISVLALDGFLSAKLDEWAPFSAQGMRSLWARETAEQRSRFYRAWAALILLFAAFLTIAARRANWLKKIAQRSEERYRNLTLQQQQTMSELKASEQRWQLALNGAGDGLWDWDLTSGVVFRSPAWKSMLGYEESEVGNSIEEWRKLVHPEDLIGVQKELAVYLEKRQDSFCCDYRIRGKDGNWRWVSDRGQAVWNENGTPIRLTGCQTDITTRKLEQEHLSLEARTDALTGLWNRREFDRALDFHARAAKEMYRNLSLCVFDLDNFKLVNDSFGHVAGDRVLKAFGKVLRDSLRRQDVCCRLGGDEFVVILPETDAGEATRLANRVCMELQSMRFESDAGARFGARCSFGVGGPGEADVLSVADGLLYAAKKRAKKQAVNKTVAV